MISYIKQYLAERRDNKYDDQLKAGYGWAWAAFNFEGTSTTELEAKAHGSSDPFDKGVRIAIAHIKLFMKSLEGKP